MGKLVPDAVLDSMLVPAEGTRIHLLTDEPANYAAIAALELGAAVMAGAYTKAPGDTDGRKNIVPAQDDVPIAVSGDGDHIAISNGVDTLLLVTTFPLQTLTMGGTADIAAFDHEIGDAQ